jgi:hypothetical protein
VPTEDGETPIALAISEYENPEYLRINIFVDRLFIFESTILTFLRSSSFSTALDGSSGAAPSRTIKPALFSYPAIRPRERRAFKPRLVALTCEVSPFSGWTTVQPHESFKGEVFSLGMVAYNSVDYPLNPGPMVLKDPVEFRPKGCGLGSSGF